MKKPAKQPSGQKKPAKKPATAKSVTEEAKVSNKAATAAPKPEQAAKTPKTSKTATPAKSAGKSKSAKASSPDKADSGATAKAAKAGQTTKSSAGKPVVKPAAKPAAKRQANKASVKPVEPEVLDTLQTRTRASSPPQGDKSGAAAASLALPLPEGHDEFSLVGMASSAVRDRAIRLRVIASLYGGKSPSEAAEENKVDLGKVYLWLGRFRDGGVEAI